MVWERDALQSDATVMLSHILKAHYDHRRCSGSSRHSFIFYIPANANKEFLSPLSASSSPALSDL